MEIKMVLNRDTAVITGDSAELHHILRDPKLKITPTQAIEKGGELTIIARENIHSFIDAMIDYSEREARFWAEAYASGS